MIKDKSIKRILIKQIDNHTIIDKCELSESQS